MKEEQLSGVLGEKFLPGNGVNHLTESVNYCEDGGVAVGVRETSDKVKGDVRPGQ